MHCACVKCAETVLTLRTCSLLFCISRGELFFPDYGHLKRKATAATVTSSTLSTVLTVRGTPPR